MLICVFHYEYLFEKMVMLFMKIEQVGPAFSFPKFSRSYGYWEYGWD